MLCYIQIQINNLLIRCW